MGEDKPRIAVLGAGGTISTLGRRDLDLTDYVEKGRKLNAAEVLAGLPALSAIARCEPIALDSISSSAIGPDHWRTFARLCRRFTASGSGYSGVVILHGTGSLEESAYFLNLVLDTRRPVVLVGSQRPFNSLSSDAAMNLLTALRVAAEPQSAGRGVLVVMNNEIHSARAVTKADSYALNAFQSPGHGPLGRATAEEVHFYRRCERRHSYRSAFRSLPLSPLPRVDLVSAYGGADAVAIRAFLEAGARGLVSAGFAPGLPAMDQRPALEAAARAGVLVVQASRAASGAVVRRGYLRDHGMIAAGDLSPQKARILLALALTRSRDPEAVQEIFDSH